MPTKRLLKLSNLIVSIHQNFLAMCNKVKYGSFYTNKYVYTLETQIKASLIVLDCAKNEIRGRIILFAATMCS